MEKKIENRIKNNWCEVCGCKDTEVVSNAAKTEWRVRCSREKCREVRNYMSHTPPSRLAQN